MHNFQCDALFISLETTLKLYMYNSQYVCHYMYACKCIHEINKSVHEIVIHYVLCTFLWHFSHNMNPFLQASDPEGDALTYSIINASPQANAFDTYR